MNPLATTTLADLHIRDLHRDARAHGADDDRRWTPRPMPVPPTTPRLIVGRLVARLRGARPAADGAAA